MDQVKIYLRILKKHHFWVLCGFAALVSYVCWWMGANSLANETKANEGKVKGAYSALEGVNKSPRPPNGTFEEGVKAKNEDLKKKVLDEWRQRYDQQQQLFKWPALVADKVASPKADDPTYIQDDVRLLCRNKEVFLSQLREKVFLTADYRRPKAQADAQDAGEAGADAPPKANAPPAAADASPEEEGLVLWSKSHRDSLEQRYTLFRQIGTPTSLDIRLAQEDMWVLENLAKVIRQTNEGAEDVIAVPIKRIDSLDIAQWAINEAVRESPKVFVEKSDSSGPVGGMGGGGGAAGGETPAPETDAEKAKLADDQLLNGRYIADTGLPLTSADSPPYAEFKLMFVRLKVVIDQRKIPDLLRNCGNAPIPIEVVRVTMHEPLVSSGTVATNNPAPGGGAGSGLGGLRGGGGGAAAAAPQPAQHAAGGKDDDIEANPSDVTVEICGLVQIYNPPDKPDETDDTKKKLGTGTAQDPGKRPAGVPTVAVAAPRGGSGSGRGQVGGSGGGLGNIRGK